MQKIKAKLKKAVEYLKAIGCKEVILFGSLAEGKFDELSDIDIAVSGISPRSYFKAVANLPLVVDGKVDLVALDYIPPRLRSRIKKEGKILYGK